MNWKEIYEKYMRGGGLTPEEAKAYKANLSASRSVNKIRTTTTYSRYLWEDGMETQTRAYSAAELRRAVLEYGRLLKKLPCPY